MTVESYEMNDYASTNQEATEATEAIKVFKQKGDISKVNIKDVE